MEISSFCEIITNSDFIVQADQVEQYSSRLLEYLIKNKIVSDFSDKYNYALEICICDNEFIHDVNKKYRNLDNPTDVITFALYSDSDKKFIIDNTISLGQIVISSDKIFLQAKENAVTPEYEFLNLLSHGILHLLGLDHKDDNSLETMLKLQRDMIGVCSDVKV